MFCYCFSVSLPLVSKWYQHFSMTRCHHCESLLFYAMGISLFKLFNYSPIEWNLSNKRDVALRCNLFGNHYHRSLLSVLLVFFCCHYWRCAIFSTLLTSLVFIRFCMFDSVNDIVIVRVKESKRVDNCIFHFQRAEKNKMKTVN